MPKTRKLKLAKPKHRTYDNVAREEASAENRKLIIHSLVDLLVERKGGDVSLAEVAKYSGLSQRTIFRFFKDKQALLQATGEYVGKYLQESNAQLTQENLLTFVKEAFKSFERNPNLVMAYLFSPFGQNARSVLRKELNPILSEKLRADFQIKKKRDPKLESRIALIVSLMNTRLWYELKSDYGMSGEESGELVAWAMETLAKSLND